MKALIIGFGSVARCVLPLLFARTGIERANVAVMDFEDKKAEVESMGARFVRVKLTEGNYSEELSKVLRAGDLLVDLAWDVATKDLLSWCHENGVFYINTSVEIWNSRDNFDIKPLYEKTLHYRHQRIRRMTGPWPKKSITAVVDHGANPGLISHFVKQGLVDIARKAMNEPQRNGYGHELQDRLSKGDYPNLARLLGVKVIHCSERDTQVSAHPRLSGEFVNTWSVDGLHEEGISPTELGWGTHETELPQNAATPPEGAQNQIFLPQMGINTFVRSFVPNQEITGMAIRHGEGFTISEHLTSIDVHGRPGYRPTVHYVYMPCDAAIASLKDLRENNYRLPGAKRILRDPEIVSGKDILGALLMGHRYSSWWCGSILDITEAKRLVPNQNATTVQVAIGVVSGISWMLKNPRSGFCVPDDLPHDYILNFAKPYLGEFISREFDWTPVKNISARFSGKSPRRIDRSNIWKFQNFLVKN